MKRIRVFRTESFRLAAWFAVLFLALAGIFIYAVYRIVDNIQTEALVSIIDADINTINNGFKKEGINEAIEVIQQRLGAADFSNVDLPGGYILLQDKNSRLIAGNLLPRKPKVGLFVSVDPDNPKYKRDKHGQVGPGCGSVLGRGVLLSDGLYLYVGRDMATIAMTHARILRAFAWMTGITILLAILGGMFFSMQFMRRIDAIIKICDAIVAGSFRERIANTGDDNELDRLGKAINSMLDRIAMLLDNLRQVSSDIAHDLRTPLTHLRHRLEHARDKSTTLAEYSSAVSSAIGDTDHLLKIFSALLRISQIESGTRAAAFATLSLSDLSSQLFEMRRPVAEDQGHLLVANIQREVVVLGDNELLKQLVVNLVENSLRHTPPGTAISLDLVTVDNHVVLTVSDSGPGIAAEEREKVFRRFYRVSTSRATPGNGLGLALVKAIADLHHARIDVSDNSPGLRISIIFMVVIKPADEYI